MRADLVVHATTEAGFKTGGVGATLFGLLSLPRYHEDVARTILLGPFSRKRAAEFDRVRRNVKVRYLAATGTHDLPDGTREKFAALEARYGVEILYGTRSFRERTVEVILVDGTRADRDRLNEFKTRAWELTGLPSDRYESIEGYDECMAVAVPGLRAVYTLTDLKSLPRKLLVAHDVPAMPFLYASGALDFGLVTRYLLHEVSCARHFVEWHAGGDLAFYNAMARALERGGDASPAGFPECVSCHKGAMFRTLDNAGRVLALGDRLPDELAFVLARRTRAQLSAVYRGVPHYEFPAERKTEARRKIATYVSSLLGFLPDHIFTHVSRLVPSKMLSRDLAVLRRLDPLLAAEGRRAVHLFLASAVPEGRLPEDVLEMERTYGWPAHHRRGFPDLIGGEADLGAEIARFNEETRAIRAVLVNQFGFGPEKCGAALPAGTEFEDLRLATDAEFGLSAYEPFGVSPLEPLTAGAVCLLSAVSGAAGLVRARLPELPSGHILLVDYAAAAANLPTAKLLAMSRAERAALEAPVADAAARRLHAALPRSDDERALRMARGRELAARISWPVVYEELFRPALLD